MSAPATALPETAQIDADDPARARSVRLTVMRKLIEAANHVLQRAQPWERRPAT